MKKATISYIAFAVILQAVFGLNAVTVEIKIGDETFNLDKNAAEKSKVLKNMISDLGKEEEEKIEVPLPESLVTKDQMSAIQAFLPYDLSNQEVSDKLIKDSKDSDIAKALFAAHVLDISSLEKWLLAAIESRENFDFSLFQEYPHTFQESLKPLIARLLFKDKAGYLVETKRVSLPDVYYPSDEEGTFDTAAAQKNYIKISPNMKYCAFVTTSENVCVLDIENNEKVYCSNEGSLKVSIYDSEVKLLFSPNEAYFAFSNGTEIEILETKNWQKVQEIGGIDYNVSFLFSPDSKFFGYAKSYRDPYTYFTTQPWRPIDDPVKKGDLDRGMSKVLESQNYSEAFLIDDKSVDSFKILRIIDFKVYQSEFELASSISSRGAYLIYVSQDHTRLDFLVGNDLVFGKVVPISGLNFEQLIVLLKQHQGQELSHKEQATLDAISKK